MLKEREREGPKEQKVELKPQKKKSGKEDEEKEKKKSEDEEEEDEEDERMFVGVFSDDESDDDDSRLDIILTANPMINNDFNFEIRVLEISMKFSRKHFKNANH